MTSTGPGPGTRSLSWKAKESTCHVFTSHEKNYIINSIDGTLKVATAVSHLGRYPDWSVALLALHTVFAHTDLKGRAR